MKFVTSTFAVSLLLLSAFSAQAETPATFETLLAKSAAAASTSDWRIGASISRQILAMPGLTKTQTAAGWSHLCTHLTNDADFDGATVACNKSVALAPASYAGYLNRGNLLLAMGDRAGARREYNKAVALNPTSPALSIAVSFASPASWVIPSPSDAAQLAAVPAP